MRGTDGRHTMKQGDRLRWERREFPDPATGRRVTQVTSGDEYCYPLYYFGPSVTGDGRLLLLYRYRGDEVQNWRLDLESGEAVCLTSATTPGCLWRGVEKDRAVHGVRELMSAFSPATEEMLHFDGNAIRSVHVRTLADRLVHELPEERVPCGLPGMSPDGKWLALLHADRRWWEEAWKKGTPVRTEAKDVRLDLLDVAAGRRRTLIVMNSWLTHANFHGNDRVIFCHHPTECAILMTDLRGGWYTHLRTQTSRGWIINHYVSTPRGILYEMCSPLPHGAIGRVNADTCAYEDFLTNHPIHHIGNDPAGRLWFGDYYALDALYDRVIGWLPRLRGDRVNEFMPLTAGMRPYGDGQRSHLHATLMPDRRRIFFTGPDDRTRTNHVFLLDVSDLADAETDVGPGLTDQRI